MATIELSDIISGVITQKERGYAIAELTLNEGVDVALDDRVLITNTYTSENESSNKNIFDGWVEDYSLDKFKEVVAVSKGIEMENPVSGYYSGYRGEIASKILDACADFLSADYGPYEVSGYYNAPFNFRTQYGLNID